MVRNADPDGPATIFTGKPKTYDEADFVPLEMAQGDMVVIHGAVVHKSDANQSNQSRHAYTFHIIETGEGHEYAPDNWLQLEAGGFFDPLYEHQDKAR